MELVEAVDAGGGLLGDTAPLLDHLVPAGRGLLEVLLEEVLDDLLLVVAGGGIDPAVPILEFVALVDEEGDVTAVVDDHLGALSAREADRLVGAPPVFLEGLALPGKDGDAGRGDRGGCLILGREDVAAGPTDVGSEIDEGLDEDRRLDGHVEGACDADALEGLLLGVLGADRHEAGHLLLGDVDLLAAPLGECDVGYFVIGKRGHGSWELEARD
jgi:hypothetical protein